MKIFVDENIPTMTVAELRELGHDVKDIRGTALQGIPDTELWQLVQKEARLLITTDKGFAEHRDEGHKGLLIIRLKQLNRKKIHRRVIQAIKHYSEKQWHGLMVIMRDSVQSRWKSRKIS